jgi:hypothetical protein
VVDVLFIYEVQIQAAIIVDINVVRAVVIDDDDVWVSTVEVEVAPIQGLTMLESMS